MPGDDTAEIARIRSLGRKAGRELGWRIQTFASDPAQREDGMSVVIVVATESTPLHQELMRVRGEKRIRAAMQSWGLGE